jgi:hypothetical protein
MGSWDCYCGICGGPFHKVSVAKQPRSERFLRRHGLSQPDSSGSAQADLSGKDGHGNTTAESGDNKAANKASEEEVTPEDREEDGSYDPDVITSEETAWLKDVHILMTSEDVDTGEKV